MAYMTEQELYAESRRLKFKAREMRKKRIEREIAYEEKLRKQRLEFAEAQRREVQRDDAAYKEDVDRRIKNVMLAFAATLKMNGLAIDAPPQWTEARKHAMTLIDVSRSDPARSGKMYEIKAKADGFEW